jgi:hypothetical protein
MKCDASDRYMNLKVSKGVQETMRIITWRRLEMEFCG